MDLIATVTLTWVKTLSIITWALLLPTFTREPSFESPSVNIRSNSECNNSQNVRVFPFPQFKGTEVNYYGAFGRVEWGNHYSIYPLWGCRSLLLGHLFVNRLCM